MTAAWGKRGIRGHSKPSVIINSGRGGGVGESARVDGERVKLGVNKQWFDVGGRLGEEHEDPRATSDCSVKYGLN